MENRNEIAMELSALSALVAGINRVTPYGVPEGYFGQFPSNVLRRIAAKSSTFQVPEGYFDGFAGSVLSRIKTASAASTPSPDEAGGESIQQELARLSPTVSRISRDTPYRLPEGFFEELSPVLSLIKDKQVYEIPEGYFSELTPVLTVAHDRSTYRAPEGYFDSLPDQILEKVAEPVAGAKVISMRPLKGHWWSYASASAAAIAACFLLIFSLPGIDTNHESVATAERALRNLSDQDLQGYLDSQHAILAESLDQHGIAGEAINNSTATVDMNEGEVKSLLSGISDDDLQQYMEEHGKAEDFATN